MDVVTENRHLVQRYYEQLWNEWNFALATEIVTQDIRFRGSLGIEARGLSQFLDYMRLVQSAFPDFANEIVEMVAEHDAVAARLTYTGTHQGEILGFGGTGRRVKYSGAAFFKIAGDRIFEAWVLGDTQNLVRQLSTTPAGLRRSGRYKGKPVEVV